MSRSPRQQNLITNLVLWIGGGIILATLAYFNYNTFTQLGQLDPDSAACIRIQAQVIGRQAPSPSYKQGKARLDYAYQVGEKRYEHSEPVDPPLFRLYADNDSIPICYDREAPERSVIPGNEYPAVDLVQTLALDLVVLVAIIFFLLRARKSKKAGPEGE